MGLSSSLMVSSKLSSSRKLSGSSGSRLNRTKRKLSFLFCGAFTSKSTFELEDHPVKSSSSCTIKLAPISDDSQNSIVESSSMFSSPVGTTSSTHENGDSSRRNNSNIEEGLVESALINLQTRRDQINFSNTIELFSPQPAQELVSGNATYCIAASVDTPDATTEGIAFICSGHNQSSSLTQGRTVSRAESDNLECHQNAVMDYNYSDDLRSFSMVSDALPLFQLPEDDRAHISTTSSPGILVSDNHQDLRNGLHRDVVNISSNFLSSSIAEMHSRESRRNRRRLFWEALSRRSFRRHSDSPAIVSATDLADDPGSNDRWLLDFSDNLHYNGPGHDLDSLIARRHRRNERRWLLRSEISERITGGVPLEGGRQTTFCVSGLHPDGTCSCDSFFMAEEFSNLESISRIIMLAEALFEVLDEIHHQSSSLSLSTLSLPAPEYLVDTFPLKYHKKDKNVESDPSNVQQCYICLAEYEDGDKLRVLPCNHEYHIPCIDKWLKDVNRVCPLCRYDVCDGHGECSASNTTVSSQ